MQHHHQAALVRESLTGIRSMTSARDRRHYSVEGAGIRLSGVPEVGQLIETRPGAVWMVQAVTEHQDRYELAIDPVKPHDPLVHNGNVVRWLQGGTLY